MEPAIRKIAVIVPKYGLVGGGERFVMELTERIALHPGLDVHVFANRWRAHSERITFHKVPLVTFPKFFSTFSFAWFVRRQTARISFDLIHAHERVFAADIVTLHSIPHQVWVREVRRKRPSLFDRVTQAVEQRQVANPGVRQFLPVSNLAREKFLQHYAVDPAKVRVVHPGVAVERFQTRDPDQRIQIRRRFGLSPADIVLLFVGMNFEIKGLDTLMAAVAQARRQRPLAPIKLLVVGKGNYRKYRRLATRLALLEATVFTGVWADRIEAVYQASDVFLLLSEFDTFGMAVLEAMAAALPVIVSDRVGAQDLVQEGGNGFVIAQRDVAGVAARIVQLLDGPTRARMAAAARRTAQANTWEAMAAKMLPLYTATA